MAKSRVDSHVVDAYHALDCGQQVFVPLLGGTPTWTADEWAKAVQEIEEVGWRLEHWSPVYASAGLFVLPVFRRAD